MLFFSNFIVAFLNLVKTIFFLLFPTVGGLGFLDGTWESGTLLVTFRTQSAQIYFHSDAEGFSSARWDQSVHYTIHKRNAQQVQFFLKETQEMIYVDFSQVKRQGLLYIKLSNDKVLRFNRKIYPLNKNLV